MKLNNKKNKKQKSNFFKFIKQVFIILSVFVIVLIFAVTGIVGGAIISYVRSTEPLTAEDLILKGSTSKIYDSNSNLVMQLYADKNREMIDSKDIPKKLKLAFVAIEDKRFYEHSGIDIIRLSRSPLGN